MNLVDFYQNHAHQLWLSLIVISGWLITRFLTKRAIKNLSIRLSVAIERRRMIVKVTNIIFFLFTLIFIITIWGVDKNKLFLFFTSIITVLGIAFFAQWSILSNITAGIIIFFSHPIKLGDHIKIIEKDFFVEGKLSSISFFYMHLQDEDGQIITIPNSVVFQKMIVVKEG